MGRSIVDFHHEQHTSEKCAHFSMLSSQVTSLIEMSEEVDLSAIAFMIGEMPTSVARGYDRGMP